MAEDGVGGWRFTVVVEVVVLWLVRRVGSHATVHLVLKNDVQGVDDAGDVWRREGLSACGPQRRVVRTAKTYNRGWSTAG